MKTLHYSAMVLIKGTLELQMKDRLLTIEELQEIEHILQKEYFKIVDNAIRHKQRKIQAEVTGVTIMNGRLEE